MRCVMKLKKWHKNVLKVLLICLIMLFIHYFTGAKEYVQYVCDNSLTVQKWKPLDFGCGVVTLDWKRMDSALSEIDFEFE